MNITGSRGIEINTPTENLQIITTNGKPDWHRWKYKCLSATDICCSNNLPCCIVILINITGLRGIEINIYTENVHQINHICDKPSVANTQSNKHLASDKQPHCTNALFKYKHEEYNRNISISSYKFCCDQPKLCAQIIEPVHLTPAH
jgi:hypothetical protein